MADGKTPPTLTPTGRFAGKPELTLSRTVTLVGAGAHARLQLISSTVSRNHAILVNCNRGAYVRDLGSRTGVLVNGTPVREAVLNDGDELQIGKFTFRFNAAPGAEPAHSHTVDSPPNAAVQVSGVDDPVALSERTLVIGRRENNDVVIDDENVSTAHAIIFEMDARRYIRDLGSRSGTFLNDKQVHQAELNFDDVVRMAQIELRYIPAAPVAEAEAPPVEEVEAPSTDATAAAGAAVAAGALAPEEPDIDLAPLPVQEPSEEAEESETDLAPQPVAKEPEPDLAPIPIEEPEPDVAQEMEIEPWREAEAPVADDRAEYEPFEPSAPEQEETASSAQELHEFKPLEPESVRETTPEEKNDAAEEQAVAEAGQTDQTVEPTVELDAEQLARSETQLEPEDLTEAQPVPEGTSAPWESRDQPATEQREVDRPGEEQPSPQPVTSTETEGEDVFRVPDEPERNSQRDGTDVAVAEPGDSDLRSAPVEDLSLDDAPPEQSPSLTAIDEPLPELRIEPVEDEPIAPISIGEPDLDLEVPPLNFSNEVEVPTFEDLESAPTPELRFDVDTEEIAPIKPVAPSREALDLKLPADPAPQVESRAPVIEPEPSPVELRAPEPVVEPEPPSVELRAPEVVPEPAPAPEPQIEDRAAVPTPAEEQPIDVDEAPVDEAPAEPIEIDEPLMDISADRARVDQDDEHWRDAEHVAEAPTIDHAEIEPHDEAPVAVDEIPVAEAPDEQTLIAVDRSALEAAPPTDQAITDQAPLDESAIDELLAEAPRVEAERPQEPYVEVIESSEPSSSPAQEMEEALAKVEGELPDSLADSSELTDTNFRHAVEEFAGASTGPLVEEQATPPAPALPQDTKPAAPQPVAEAPSEQPKPAPPMAPAPTWGANQEHFLGGMPLPLGKPGAAPPAPPRAPAPPPRPRISAEQRPQRSAPQPKSGGMSMMDLTTAPEKPEAKHIDTGFNGLAMPVREADVFSDFPLAEGEEPPPIDDVFARRPSAQPAPARKAKRAPRTEPEQVEPEVEPQQLPEPQPQDAAPAPDQPEAPQELAQPEAPRKKRRWFGLRSLLLLMLLSAPAVGAGIYYALPEESYVVGKVTFQQAARSGAADFAALPDEERARIQSLQHNLLSGDDFAALPDEERARIQSLQHNLLSGDDVRTLALEKLRAHHNGLRPGLLDSSDAYKQAISWTMNPQTGELHIVCKGADRAGDPARVRALLMALHELNTPMVAIARSARQEIQALTRATDEAEKRVAGLTSQLKQLEQTRAPDARQVQRLESDVRRLETAYRESDETVSRLVGEIEEVRQQIAASEDGAPDQPVDPQLVEDEQSLRKLNERMANVKDMRLRRAEQARRAMESAMAAFEKEIERAHAAIKDNPELSAYLSGAEKLIESTRDLTDQLIRRQQDQYARLSELKSRLDEKLAARRDDQMNSDPKLREYSEQRQIKTRQYHAALGTGLAQEAEELKAELNLLDQLIRARQTQVGDDTFFAETIDQLQKIIDSTRKGIEDDRRHTARVLEQMELALAQSRPASEKLPEDQQRLTADLHKHLEAVASARRHYTEAAELANAQTDEEIRQMETGMTTLSERIAARRRQLELQTNREMRAISLRGFEQTLARKLSELEQVQQIRDAAKTAHQEALARLDESRTQAQASREAAQRSSELAATIETTQRELDQLSRQLDQRRAQLASMTELAPLADDHVVNHAEQSQRQMFALAGAGGTAAIFMFLILLNFARGNGQSVRLHHADQDEI